MLDSFGFNQLSLLNLILSFISISDIMIEIQQLVYLVIGIFNAAAKILKFTYFLSVIVGRHLAECIVFAVKGMWTIVEGIASAVTILYEDYLFFLEDVVHKLGRIASILSGAVHAIVSLFVNAYSSVKNFILWTQDSIILYFNAFLGILEKLYNISMRIPEMLKHAIILIGTGCYFALQIIPVAIVYVLSMIVFMVGRSFEEIISITTLIKHGFITLFNGVVQFFMDLPPEALIGLAFGCFALYMSVKYVSMITEVMKQTVLFCRAQIHQAFTYLWVKLDRLLLWMFTNDRSTVHTNVPVAHPTTSKPQVDSEYSDLCVVCQDRQKCVIIFPCRHLCLCNECCALVQQQNGRCPLCRRTVSRVMKVYV